MITSFRSMLVPLDGSPVAEQALPLGALLARRAGVPLHLVSVSEPVPAAVLAEVGVYEVDLEAESRARLGSYLAGVARGLDREPHAELIEGDPAEALAEYVANHPIDLVVMTTHARHGLARWWLGSVADGLLRRLSIPVLLLHPSDQPQPTRLRRILVALNATAAPPLLQAAKALGSLEERAEYTLLRVVEPASRNRAEAAEEQSARHHLEDLAAGLRDLGLSVNCHVLQATNVAEEVTTLARASGADCIVVGTRGPSEIERLIAGTVADKVLRESELPVLVVPVGAR